MTNKERERIENDVLYLEKKLNRIAYGFAITLIIYRFVFCPFVLQQNRENSPNLYVVSSLMLISLLAMILPSLKFKIVDKIFPRDENGIVWLYERTRVAMNIIFASAIICVGIMYENSGTDATFCGVILIGLLGFSMGELRKVIRERKRKTYNIKIITAGLGFLKWECGLAVFFYLAALLFPQVRDLWSEGMINSKTSSITPLVGENISTLPFIVITPDSLTTSVILVFVTLAVV